MCWRPSSSSPKYILGILSKCAGRISRMLTASLPIVHNNDDCINNFLSIFLMLFGYVFSIPKHGTSVYLRTFYRLGRGSVQNLFPFEKMVGIFSTWSRFEEDDCGMLVTAWVFSPSKQPTSYLNRSSEHLSVVSVSHSVNALQSLMQTLLVYPF